MTNGLSQIPQTPVTHGSFVSCPSSVREVLNFEVRRILPVALLLALLMPGTQRALAESAPVLTGKTDCAWGSDDCNVCVPDPVDAINRLRDHGDILGFHMNGAEDVFRDPHWQGVQRLVGSNAQYLAVSRSLKSHQTQAVVIAKMASRNDAGLRFRSNRLDPDWPVEDTSPPSDEGRDDGIVATIPTQAGFTHAGGIQLTGSILAVPYEHSGTGSRVVFYDLSDPEDPDELYYVDHSDLSDEAGTASMIKLQSGHFLLIIGRADANTLDFYASLTTDIRTTAFDSSFYTWHDTNLQTDIGDRTFGQYQSINLLTACDGTLYAVGTHNNTQQGDGADFVDLYRIENGVGNAVTITKVAKRQVYCTYNGHTGKYQHCNLDAAGGIYLDPEGQLYVYATEHENDGPYEDGVFDGQEGSVKFEEFRPIPHGTCDSLDDAWVELYVHDTYQGRSLMIDFPDRDLEDHSDYGRAEEFEGEASSVRWCLPAGTTHRLWDETGFSGKYRDLAGTGMLEGKADLEEWKDSEGEHWGDRVRSSEWIHGPTADAGEDQIVECRSPHGTDIGLDGSGSTPSSSDTSIAYWWQAPNVTFDDASSVTPVGRFPFGEAWVELTVSSGGQSDTDTALMSVVDTTPPDLSCPSDITGYPMSPAGTVVEFEASSWSDVCDGNLPTPTCPLSGSTFAVGSQTEVSCSVTDTTASLSSSCSFDVVVLSESEMVGRLRSELREDLAPNLNRWRARALRRHIWKISRALNRGRTRVVCVRLNGYYRKLWRSVKADVLTLEDVSDSMEIVDSLRATLACRRN